jgi:hypothetical protein
MIQHLPSNYKALSSNPSTTKKLTNQQTKKKCKINHRMFIKQRLIWQKLVSRTYKRILTRHLWKDKLLYLKTGKDLDRHAQKKIYK